MPNELTEQQRAAMSNSIVEAVAELQMIERDVEYRRLEEGEVVLPTDECLHESGEWRPAQGYIGKPAPDPKYTAHCQFRRRETEGAELRPDPKAEILTRLDEHLSEAGHEFQPMYCAFCYSYQQTFWKISQNPR
ncbi:hypothetical protein [Geitlerinema calcuttense]|uniref:Uncharacterized protein n=1 Tax=Geitlerinema calcuttense NRMC-F 0142 TaxID=2922238 RepID=A0ABT7LWE6_9CYAN|nr:hypothetical protein [Geitlerinema calcuttense]MDL5055877.1 hypothetical protein [Geitlerinema calcuttense NRMC-F 0142]